MTKHKRQRNNLLSCNFRHLCRERKNNWDSLVRWTSESSVFLVQLLALLVLWASWKELEEQVCYIVCPEKCAEELCPKSKHELTFVLRPKYLGRVDTVFFAPWLWTYEHNLPLVGELAFVFQSSSFFHFQWRRWKRKEAWVSSSVKWTGRQPSGSMKPRGRNACSSPPQFLLFLDSVAT